MSGKYVGGKGKGTNIYQPLLDTLESCARECDNDNVSPYNRYKPSTSKGHARPASKRSVSKGYHYREPSKGEMAVSKSKPSFPSRNGYPSKGKSEVRVGNECCKGGASFLQVKLSGEGRKGRLTFEIMQTLPDSSSPSKDGTGKGTSLKQNEDRVQFIDCKDPCIDSADEPCNSVHSDANVTAEQSVCFATWNPSTKTIDFETNMPSLVLRFNAAGQEDDFLAAIYTSCSEPLYPPFALEMNKKSCMRSIVSPILEFENTTNPVLHFEDGMASSFYFEMSGSRNDVFDSKFSSCGCICKETTGPLPATTTLTPSMVATRTTPPSPSPTSSDGGCSERCWAYVESHCVIPGSELNASQPCTDDPRRSLSFTNPSGQEANPLHRIANRAEYHYKISDLLKLLLDSRELD